MIQQQRENDLNFNIYSKHQENANIFPYMPLQRNLIWHNECKAITYDKNIYRAYLFNYFILLGRIFPNVVGIILPPLSSKLIKISLDCGNVFQARLRHSHWIQFSFVKNTVLDVWRGREEKTLRYLKNKTYLHLLKWYV